MKKVALFIIAAHTVVANAQYSHEGEFVDKSNQPKDVTVAPEGEVFVADKENNNVEYHQITPTRLISVKPTALDFGDVANIDNELKLEVINDGDEPLQVNEITSSNRYFRVDKDLPFSVSPNGGREEVKIIFGPVTLGTEEGVLSFSSDTTNTDPTVSVKGNCAWVSRFKYLSFHWAYERRHFADWRFYDSDYLSWLLDYTLIYSSRPTSPSELPRPRYAVSGQFGYSFLRARTTWPSGAEIVGAEDSYALSGNFNGRYFPPLPSGRILPYVGGGSGFFYVIYNKSLNVTLFPKVGTDLRITNRLYFELNADVYFLFEVVEEETSWIEEYTAGLLFGF